MRLLLPLHHVLKINGTDNVGGHSLKISYEKILFFFRQAFKKLIGMIRTFLPNWCPTYLTVSYLSFWNSSATGGRFPREVRIERCVLSLDRNLMAVACTWSSQLISDNSGTIHDCYFNAYDSWKARFELPGPAMAKVRSVPTAHIVSCLRSCSCFGYENWWHAIVKNTLFQKN